MARNRWKRVVTLVVIELERDFRTFRREWRRLFRSSRPYNIVPYLGYGSKHGLYLRGRVLEDKGISLSTPYATRWRNLVNTYKRFISDEVPHAKLRFSFRGQQFEAEADAKGYYHVLLTPDGGLTDTLWHEVQVTLADISQQDEEAVSDTNRVLVPHESACFGVISDMDDTVVQTDAAKWLRVLGTVIFGNAYSRPPFGGVAAFYRALHEGAGGNEENPLFYVSSSPWNLYDLLVEFLRLEHIPEGPLILRNWRGAGNELVPREHGEFKTGEIRRILDTFPDLRFILIGDSGQEDPEIYFDILSAYPGRILAIYIRNVSRNPVRAQAINALAEKVRELDCTLVLADDTLAAAKHAVAEGYIAPAALSLIRVQRELDVQTDTGELESQPTVVEG